MWHSGLSVTLVISDVTVSVLGCGMRSFVMLMLCSSTSGCGMWVHHGWWQRASELWLACPVVVLLSLERQSAALFWAPDIHFKGNIKCC